ncbi:MAG: MmpS family transport accessory protein, partial [Bacteroidia bacterium]
MKKLTLALIAALTIFASCKKDDDKKPNNSSRTLRYEVTGNFTGSLIASYTNASGGTDNVQITLPWNKEIAFAAGVTAANLVISGNQGVAGQKVTVVVKRGG